MPTLRVRVAAAVLAVGATGCSYFTTTRKLDMQPFAENTVTAIGELRKIEAPPVWIRLRPYFTHPAIAEIRRTGKPLLELVRGVNVYSLQVVTLNEARVPDRTKVAELVKFLRAGSERALLDLADEANVALTAERREELLRDIGGKEKYADALLAAEPIVNAVLARGLGLADEVDASIVRAANAIEGEVQGQYRAMLANRAGLLALQERTLQALAWGEAISFGDDASAERLRNGVPAVAEYLPAGHRPSARDQAATVAFLRAQAARIKAALDQLEPHYQAYRESMLELDTLRVRATENSKLARSVLMLWARSHRSLARGIEVPPMFDLAKIVMSGASTVVKGVLPF